MNVWIRGCLASLTAFQQTSMSFLIALDNPHDPPWFECIEWPVPVIFGHWAMRGGVDLPRVKGLDTGCVYGRELTGWCLEEQRHYRVRAREAYAPLSKD